MPFCFADYALTPPSLPRCRGRAENIRVSAGSSGYRPVTDGREDDEETSAGVTEKKMDVTGDIGMTADLDAVREGMLKR